MVIYKIPQGWLFRYNFNPKNIFYVIENAMPYTAYIVKATPEVMDRIRDREIEYHAVPKHIQVSIAATQSVLAENNFEETQKLHKIINRIKGD